MPVGKKASYHSQYEITQHSFFVVHTREVAANEHWVIRNKTSLFFRWHDNDIRPLRRSARD